MTEEQPVLRVVRGEPSAEELAALVAVLAARQAATGTAAGSAAPRPVSAWRDRRRLVREPLPHGPGAWRASAWR